MGGPFGLGASSNRLPRAGEFMGIEAIQQAWRERASWWCFFLRVSLLETWPGIPGRTKHLNRDQETSSRVVPYAWRLAFCKAKTMDLKNPNSLIAGANVGEPRKASCHGLSWQLIDELNFRS